MKKIFLLFIIFLYGCPISWAENDLAKTSVLKTSTNPIIPKDLLWYQHSAERIAINREIFLAAEKNIRQKIISLKLHPKEWGVIMDIDETILNNSAWNYEHTVERSTQTWDQFAAQKKSLAIPGAVEFTQHIHEMGGYVNLVSNRNIRLLEQTKQNLVNEHIYFDQILLDVSKKGILSVNKNERFNAVITGKLPSTLPKQKVMAWLGDNIQDFPNLMQDNLIKNPLNPAYDLFGEIYFIFPNPLYGSWETHRAN